MLLNKGSLFETIYSLPVITNSIPSRTPTAGYPQESRFMPDFGGTLDIPGTSLKNNSLSSGIPFKPRPEINLVECRNEHPEGSPLKPLNHDCIVALKYLDSSDEGQFSVARALGNTLFLDSFNEVLDQETSDEYYISIPYAHVPYMNNISGIKRQLDFLLIKFSQGYKTIQLNKSFHIDQHSAANDGEEVPQQQAALDFVASINEINTKDACLNKHNSTLQAIGISCNHDNHVKLYDLSRPRNPLYTVSWSSSGTDGISSTVREHNLRTKVVRSYAPANVFFDGIEQLDQIPSHLVNMLVTTSTQTCLLDPRQENIAQVIVDKSKSTFFYPIEYMKKSEFSQRNNYQFYSLSNVHLRVFDTRYHNTPMNQINHMLESNPNDTMNLKLITYTDSDLETLCSSSSGKLCLSTVDQARVEKLVNPKVAHKPYIEPTLNKFMNDRESDLFGLDIMSNKSHNLNEGLFLTFQLSTDGDLCLRRFLPSRGTNEMDVDSERPLEVILQSDRRIRTISSEQNPIGDDLNIAAVSESEPDTNNEFLDILQTDILTDPEDRFESRRALDRFMIMKNKLDG